MYRPSPSATAARNFVNNAVRAGTNALVIAGEAMLGALIQLGIYEQAQRENRRHDRAARRHSHSARNAEAGLNGTRAVARRLRQIEAGSLRVANGLVS